MKIVVIGGTGLIGSRVVSRLRERGHEVVPASPRLGINSVTGEGLTAALDGAAVVVDVSNSANFEYRTALDFFQASNGNLLPAAKAADVGHLVALSVVGTKELSKGGDAETTTAGYFVAKLLQESMIAGSGIPWSIVHATQFFEFIAGIADVQTVGGVVRLPPVQFQPMAADDPAAEVAAVALEPPIDGIVEVGGPERDRFDAIMRRVLDARSDDREVVADPDAGYYGIAVGERTLVPADGARVGSIRLDDWLRESLAAAATESRAG
jgi:uncharacterized protein YbjT (DUF2867 family)